MFKQIILPILVFLLLQTNLFPQFYDEFNSEIDYQKKSSLLKNATWAITATYVDDGTKIISHNSNLAIAPASNLKLFTTSLALELLGENYRFETRIYFVGKIDNKGVLNGDIVIRGAGDPTFGSKTVPGSLSADSIATLIIVKCKELKIKSLTGTIVADESLFDDSPIPSRWEWSDIGNYYAAAPSALSFNDNFYTIYFTPSDTVGSPARLSKTSPKLKNLKFENHVLTGEKGSGDRSIIYCPPFRNIAELRGTVPTGVKEFSVKGAIPDPALYAARFFMDKLNNAGIKCSQEAKKSDKKIKYDKIKNFIKITSPPLSKIVKLINKKSINLYTEILLRKISSQIQEIGSTDDGISILLEYLRKSDIKTDGINLYDGSGLSHGNTITTDAMVDLLILNCKKEYFESFRNSLVVAGDSTDAGFVKKYPQTPELDNNLIMKTGYIENVRGESGYVKDASGRLIAFCMLANNYRGKAADIDDIHRQLLLMLARLK